MVYFEPVGGLANRLRAIDSIFPWVEQYGMDLTLLWLNNFQLNAPWESLFEPLVYEGERVKLMNCPEGYPNYFIKTKRNKLAGQDYFVLRSFKNFLRGHRVSGELRLIADQLGEIKNAEIIDNKTDLNPVYYSVDQDNMSLYRELDNYLIQAFEPKLKQFFESSGKNRFMSCCYRIAPITSNYSYLKPVASIQAKIEQTASAFIDTVGLHIRRSDHVVSIEKSSDEKFYRLIDQKLEENPKRTFFLSTDDAVLKKAIEEKYGACILSNKIESYDRNAQSSIENAVWDMFCLSRTTEIYGSHQSSFSQVAADIGGIKETTVS